MTPFARGLAWALLAVLACGCGGSNQTLDVATATTVLAAQLPAAMPFFRFVNGMAAADDSTEAGVYEVLVRRGILQSYAAPSLFGSAPQRHYRLTANGAALTRYWRKEEHGVYEVSVGTLQLERVSAVDMLAPGHAMVSYTYRVELNDMGQLLSHAHRADVNFFDKLQSRSRAVAAATEPATATAEMEFYDDGWKNESWAP